MKDFKDHGNLFTILQILMLVLRLGVCADEMVSSTTERMDETTLMTEPPLEMIRISTRPPPISSTSTSTTTTTRQTTSSPAKAKPVLPVQPFIEELLDEDIYAYPAGLIPSGYNSYERPPLPPSAALSKEPWANATSAYVAVHLKKIRGLDEQEGELTWEVDIQMLWQDGRLNYTTLRRGRKKTPGGPKPVFLNPKLINRIWHPHIYIEQLVSNSKTALITVPSIFTMLPIPHPWITYGFRTTVTTVCEMDFHSYPSDFTTCQVDIKSYLYSSKDLHLSWLGNLSVVVESDVDVPGFDMFVVNGTNTLARDTGDGQDYYTISFSLNFKRHLSFHIIQTYLPSVIFIVISWCSFFIPDDQATERIGCALVSLLSLMVMLDSIGQAIPQVTYLTGLHIWMIACIVFVFIPLVEVFVVFKLWDVVSKAKKSEAKTRKEMRRKTFQAKSKAAKLNSNSPESLHVSLDSHNKNTQGQLYLEEDIIMPPSKVAISGMKIGVDALEKIMNQMETITPFAMPTLFALFNAIYWPWLVNAANPDENPESST